MFDKIKPEDVKLFKITPEQAQEERISRFCTKFYMAFSNEILAARAKKKMK
ncbi:MAG: hypothetical protein ACI9TY_001066 [Alphaproteobacteria bacterium]|jgi:hypothetical protein